MQTPIQDTQGSSTNLWNLPTKAINTPSKSTELVETLNERGTTGGPSNKEIRKHGGVLIFSGSACWDVEALIKSRNFLGSWG